jgi:hypothetical protein
VENNEEIAPKWEIMTTLAGHQFDHLMDATALIFGSPWQGLSADRLRS